MPALPLDEAGKYVAGAYLVFVALLLIYVAVMAIRLSRLDEQLEDLADLAESRQGLKVSPAGTRDEVPVDPAMPAGASAPKPAGNVAEGEASGGVILEERGV